MNVLHYATYFDCSSLVETLVEADHGTSVSVSVRLSVCT